ncbi:hypothetical protein NT6N_38370 [Oceaniferula spumae]|uniref:Uncharacterized protein n=1 Tax=Oceaniferula spumae TaxID=2979115 RepID=A0AAT9FRK9_9BACT
MEQLREGVDYCATPAAAKLFEREMVCPDGGGYSAYVDENSHELVVRCKAHGDAHK